MNTLTVSPQDERDEPSGDQLPGRPRHKPLNRITAPLLALLVAAAGFLGGIEVEKGRGGASAAGGFSRPSSGSSSRASAGFGPTGAGGGRLGAGGPGAAGGGTVGTISSISGRTIYLKETTGTTVKVILTSVTSLKKDLSVSRNSIRPGDSITVEGVTGSGGSIKAASISDSGHTSSSSSSSSSLSSSSS